MSLELATEVNKSAAITKRIIRINSFFLRFSFDFSPLMVNSIANNTTMNPFISANVFQFLASLMSSVHSNSPTIFYVPLSAYQDETYNTYSDQYLYSD